LKTKRDYNTDQELNYIEHKWWNENAVIVSKVWEMHPEISLTVRKNYLKSAKDFFLKDAHNTVVLELGCGSGWVGQFIAGPDLKIIGTDFSESQIHLAISSAKSKGLENYCDYIVSNSVDMDEMFLKVDGVLIHAFMHHLDGKEIDELLTSLKAKMRKGAKIWIYEPTFYLSTPLKNNKASLLTMFCLNITNRTLSILDKIYDKFNLVDTEIVDEFKSLTESAAKKGWYLSPKEIPFDVDEFSKHLAKYFEVKKNNWATIYSIGWVFKTNLLKNDIVRKILNKTVLPFVCYTDKKLINEIGFLQQRLTPPSYAFHVWYCVI
jgi:2-polyprenyl-3-methyl-5-hydroxy-6-metoxy-1,4-benzoquinol methylase